MAVVVGSRQPLLFLKVKQAKLLSLSIYLVCKMSRQKHFIVFREVEKLSKQFFFYYCIKEYQKIPTSMKVFSKHKERFMTIKKKKQIIKDS